MKQARLIRAGALSATMAMLAAGCGPRPVVIDAAPEIAAPVPSISAAPREQWRLTFTPDRRQAYFALSEGFFPFTRKSTIYVVDRVGAGWSQPVVAPFSGTHSDIDPFITPDGSRMYFSSIRPSDGAVRTDADIWVMERQGEGWGAPVRLGAEVNTELDELYPSAARDGTLYFASGPRAPQAGQHFDIFRAAPAGGGFAPRVALGPGVNRTPRPDDANLQDAWDFNPEISPDGSTLIFTSLRPGGYGLGDLYASHLANGEWSSAQNLGPSVNSAADEYHPTLSPDGTTLYFVRRASAGGVFHWIATAGLAALRSP